MTEVEDLEKKIKFYKDSLIRIANIFDITDPLQLIAAAENNEETYVDVLIKIIKKKIKPLIREEFDVVVETYLKGESSDLVVNEIKLYNNWLFVKFFIHSNDA